MPVISVVIPVYNVDRYLERCLKSVQESSIEDFEAIVVDDGSTDESGKICDAFARKDHRFKVIHTPNQGVSHARNTGLQHVTSDFLTFIDADDYISEQYFDSIMIKGKEDVVLGSCKDVFKERTVALHLRNDKVAGIDYLRTLVKEDYHNFPFTVWGNCYKKKLIDENHIVFNEATQLGEDFLFNIEYLKFVQTVRLTSVPEYFHEQVYTSLIHQYHPNMLEKQVAEIAALEEFVGSCQMQWRFFWWHRTINHFRVFSKKGNVYTKKDALNKLKKTYKSSFFRETIPYIRKHGTLDEKIETFLMSYKLHDLYPGICKLLIKFKR